MAGNSWAGMNMVKALASKFPTFRPIAEKALEPKRSLNEMRSELWSLRVEYWTRKFVEYPQVYRAAKVEAKELAQTLRNPSQLTYRQVAVGGLCGVQLVGAFCLGEMFGRKNIIGYDVGPVIEHGF